MRFVRPLHPEDKLHHTTKPSREPTIWLGARRPGIWFFGRKALLEGQAKAIYSCPILARQAEGSAAE